MGGISVGIDRGVIRSVSGCVDEKVDRKEVNVVWAWAG